MSKYLSSVVNQYINESKSKLEDVLMFVKADQIDTNALVKTDATFDNTIDKELRMKTGSFYTPYSLAYEMVKIAFIDYFDQFVERSFKIDAIPQAQEELVIEHLDAIKIIDIACGEGVFLLATIDLMEDLYQQIGVRRSSKSIIERIYGVDIQAEPLEILNIKLRARSDEACSINLIQADAILSDLFDQKFDIVIGNPPYVGEKGHKELFDQYKHLPEYEGRMDLFYFFIYRAFRLLSDKGVLCQITTNYWVTADSAKMLRKYLHVYAKIYRLLNLDECKWFSNAKGMHNLIFTLGKHQRLTKVKTITNVSLDTQELTGLDYEIEMDRLFSETGNILIYEQKNYFSILEKIKQASFQNLGQLAKINQGIVSGADKASQSVIQKKLDPSIVETYQIKQDDPIYVFEDQSIQTDFFKPFYKNSHIRNYKILNHQIRYILYVKEDLIDQAALDHLQPYRNLLSQRREVRQGKIPWYSLQWPRDIKIFEQEKVVVPQRATLNYFAYTSQAFYASADVYFITEGPLKVIAGVMNSKLMYFWLYNRGKRKGQNLELYAKPLSQVPFPNLSEDEKDQIIACVDLCLRGDDQREEIDKILYAYYGLSKEEIEVIDNKYPRRDYEEIPKTNQ